MNTVAQKVPRLRIPEAHPRGQGRRLPVRLALDRGPVLRSSPIRRRATAPVADALQVRRLASRHDERQPTATSMPTSTDKLEFVVNQSIWFEGEAKFADVILPACTNFERWDISEWATLRRLRARTVPDADQPPRRPAAAQVHRAAGRIEVRLPDLPRARRSGSAWAPTSPRAMNELDWVQAHVRLRSDLPQAHLLEGVPEARATTSCRPARRRTRDAGALPLVLRGPQEGRARSRIRCPATTPRIPAGACRRSRASSSSSRKPEALRPDDPERPPINKYLPLVGGAASRRDCTRAIRCSCSRRTRASASTPMGDGKDSVDQRHRRAPRAGRRLLLLDRAHQPGTTPRSAASSSTIWCACSTTAAP